MTNGARRRLAGRVRPGYIRTINIIYRFISNLLARHDRRRRASRAETQLNYDLNLLP